MERYLKAVNVNLRTYLTRFRLSNHRLPIEVGRYVNIPRNERICEFCESYAKMSKAIIEAFK